MRTIRIIFAIGLLASSVVCAQRYSADWYYQKDQSWARARIDFPERAYPGSFKNRMLEIDAWAEQNRPSLYNSSNKPYLLAEMVQREIDAERARRTVPASPPQRVSTSTIPAVSPPPTQYSASSMVQEIAESRRPSANRPAIWMGAAIIIAIGGIVAYLFYRIVSPKPGVKTATARGREWAAWTGAFVTISVLPAFFWKFDGSSFAIWIYMIVLTTPIAFIVGWLYGLIEYRRPTTGSHQENPPDALEGQPGTSPPKTGKLTKPNGLEFPENNTSTQAPMNHTNHEVKSLHPSPLKTIFALLACIAIFIFYVLIGSLLGWKSGGGAIPMVIFIAALVGTWKMIKYEKPIPVPDLSEIELDQVKQPVSSPPKTGKLINPNDFESPEIKTPTNSTPIKNTEFEVEIPEGKELENGYVEMRHNTQYSLALRNHRSVRCDAEVVIDGIQVGTWRIGKDGEIRIKRPVHDTGHFTFFAVGTEEARVAGIKKRSENGLVSVTFTPERIREPNVLYAARPVDCAQGATGLTGESKQRFVDADEIEHDTARAFTIHLRLVSARPDIRPLAPRSTPIPPPVD